MDFIAAVFGLAVGTLIAYSSAPTTRRVPYICSLVILGLGISTTIWGPVPSPTAGLIIAATVIAATLLAGGVLWKDHPGLEGQGYWSRVWIASRSAHLLRRTLHSPR